MPTHKHKLLYDQAIPWVDYFLEGQVELVPYHSISDVSKSLQSADSVLVRTTTTVNQALLAQTAISFVGSCTAGIDHVSADYLSSHQITLASASGCNANAVADYVITALHLSSYQWQGNIAIIGYGHVGKAVKKRLAEFGQSIHTYDPWLSEFDTTFSCCDWTDVLNSDVILVHASLVDEQPYPSRSLLNEQFFQALKPNVILINAARAPIIEQSAFEQWRQGYGKGAECIVDVWFNEPVLSSPEINAVNLATPHIAGYSREAKFNATYAVIVSLCDTFGFELKPKPHLGEEVILQFDDQGPSQTAINAMQMILPLSDLDRSLRNDNSEQHFKYLRQRMTLRPEFSLVKIDSNGLSDQTLDYLKACGFRMVQ